MKKLMIACILLCMSSICYASDYLDTQYGPDGLEVHLLKVRVLNDALTVAFAVENSTEKAITLAPMNINDVFYTTKNGKVPVMQDEKGEWLASSMVRGASVWGLFTNSLVVVTDIASGKKIIGWMKFKAPAETDWPVELTMPGVTPFVLEKPVQK